MEIQPKSTITILTVLAFLTVAVAAGWIVLSQSESEVRAFEASSSFCDSYEAKSYHTEVTQTAQTAEQDSELGVTVSTIQAGRYRKSAQEKGIPVGAAKMMRVIASSLDTGDYAQAIAESSKLDLLAAASC